MGTLDTVQQEQLKAIGTYLSQIRQGQDRSLEDIAAKTYIPLRLLKAIEAGQERPLPEPVFIQGFIRRYADALGLDGIDLSQKFPVHVTPLPVVATPSAKPELKLKETYESRYGNQSIEEQEPSRRSRSPRRQTIPWLPYMAAAALLALGGIGLWIVNSISSRQPTNSESTVILPKQPTPEPVLPSSSPKVPKPAASASISPTPSAQVQSASPNSTVRPANGTTPSPSAARSSPSPSPTSGNSAVNVAVNLTDASWIQVIVDGEVKEEAVFPKGTQKTWAGDQEITILAGNAGAVSVTHNGSAAKPMGATGDVKEMTFKK